MTRLIEFVIALVIVALLFVLAGLVLPDHRHIRHSVETNRPARLVFDLLNGFQRFGEWHPKRMHDPSIRYSIEGEPRGVGSVLRYESSDPRIGSGSWTITDTVQDERIEFAVESPAHGFNKTSVFTIEDRGRTVDINWEYDVSYGWNLLGRYAGMYIARTVGEDMKTGLSNLTGLLATVPNFNYDQLDVVVTEVPATTALIVSTSADRNISAVEEELDNTIRRLREVIRSNRLEETGPPRLITTVFGDKKYEFDVAIPVRVPVADEAPAAPAEGEEEAPVDPRAKLVAASAPLEDLNLPEGVVSGLTYGGRVVTANFAGHPASLPLVRDMLRAYAATHGLQVHDRAWEEYLSDITTTSVDETTFDVYWPIR